jgi:hypothetical protein
MTFPVRNAAVRIVVALALLLLVAQGYRPAKNLGVAEGPASLVQKFSVPAPVRQSLQRACYDCHSDRTRYPWYAEVQPIGWWLSAHVRDGKAAVNFSQAGTWSNRQAARKLLAIVDAVETKAMPLPSYARVHADARLSEAAAAELAGWAEELADELHEKPEV